jgi:hypothetical protein
MRAELISKKQFSKENMVEVIKLCKDNRPLLNDETIIRTFLCMYPYDTLPESMTLKMFSNGSTMFDADGFRMPFSQKAFDLAVEKNVEKIKARVAREGEADDSN